MAKKTPWARENWPPKPPMMFQAVASPANRNAKASMLRVKVSPRLKATTSPSAAATARRPGNSEVGVLIAAAEAGFARAGVKVSILFTEAHLLCPDMAEEAGRADDQHRDEDHEPDRVLEGGIEVEAGKSLGQADQEAAEIGARDAAEPPEHHHREGGQDEVAADLRGQGVDRGQEGASE